MKKLRFLVLIAFFSTVVFHLCAQDARMLHPFLWNSYYNPAAISENGKIEVNLGSQLSYLDAPVRYNSNLLTFGIPFYLKVPRNRGEVRIVAGLKLQDDDEADGFLNTVSISPTIAIGLEVASGTSLQVGIAADFYGRFLDMDKMTFGDQLDSYYGRISDVSEHFSEIQTDKIWTTDFSLGIFGKTKFTNNNEGANFELEYGAAVFHVLGNENSFIDPNEVDEVRNSHLQRYVGTLEFGFPLGNDVTSVFAPLSGSIYSLYEYQDDLQNIHCIFLAKSTWAFLGVGARFDVLGLGQVASSLTFHAGVDIPFSVGEGLRIAYTFELPLNQVSQFQATQHAISLHLVLNSFRGSGSSRKSNRGCLHSSKSKTSPNACTFKGMPR